MADDRIRLHVDHPLAEGQSVPLNADQAHYLFSVMRLGTGARLRLFNGRDGEWRAAVRSAGRRGGELVCEAQTGPQRSPPDLWLLFAPIRKARTDFIVEKATELGVARILPVQTDFTNAERLRRDRLAAHAREAAEQCGGTHVPEVADLMNRVRQPFNVSSVALAAATAALGDEEFLAQSARINERGMAQITEALAELGLEWIPSAGNFVTFKVGDSATINAALLRQGVIVRPIGGYGMPEWLRVSIGLPEENNRFIAALRQALA